MNRLRNRIDILVVVATLVVLAGAAHETRADLSPKDRDALLQEQQDCRDSKNDCCCNRVIVYCGEQPVGSGPVTASKSGEGGGSSGTPFPGDPIVVEPVDPSGGGDPTVGWYELQGATSTKVPLPTNANGLFRYDFTIGAEYMTAEVSGTWHDVTKVRFKVRHTPPDGSPTVSQLTLTKTGDCIDWRFQGLPVATCAYDPSTCAGVPAAFKGELQGDIEVKIEGGGGSWEEASSFKFFPKDYPPCR